MRRTENSFYLLLATQLLLLTNDHILIKKKERERKNCFLSLNQKSWTSQSFSARHFNLILGTQKRIHPALLIKGFLIATESWTCFKMTTVREHIRVIFRIFILAQYFFFNHTVFILPLISQVIMLLT